MADLLTLGNDPSVNFVDANSLLSGVTNNAQLGNTGGSDDLLSQVTTGLSAAGSFFGALFGTNSNNTGMLGGASSQQPYLDQYGRTYYLVNGQAVYPANQTVTPSNGIVRYNTAATAAGTTDNTLLYAGLGLAGVALVVVLGKKR